jgi:hypothetical protein
VEAARKERCRRKLNAATDYAEMQEVATSPVCAVAYVDPKVVA